MVANRKPRAIDRSSPAWLITYGDMATLLLVFFVFLFSVSEVKEEKFRAATGALRAQIGLRPRKGSVVESPVPAETRRREHRTRERRGLPGESERVLGAAQGARVVVGGRVTFGRGSADIRDRDKETLRRLADRVRGLSNVVEVRGHAEPGEETASGGDELDISLERAGNVLRFLHGDAGLRLGRLRAMGSGSQEPADAGLYREQPDRNRRVEIVVVREIVEGGAEGRSPSP